MEQPQEGRATTALFILPGEEEAQLVGAAGDLQTDRRGVPLQRAGVQVGSMQQSPACLCSLLARCSGCAAVQRQSRLPL